LPQQSSKSGCGGGCGCGSGAVDGVIVGDICAAGWAAVISLVEHLDLPSDHLDAGPAPQDSVRDRTSDRIRPSVCFRCEPGKGAPDAGSPERRSPQAGQECCCRTGLDLFWGRASAACSRTALSFCVRTRTGGRRHQGCAVSGFDRPCTARAANSAPARCHRPR
jgi:hypothetical protein